MKEKLGVGLALLLAGCIAEPVDRGIRVTRQEYKEIQTGEDGERYLFQKDESGIERKYIVRTDRYGRQTKYNF